MNLPPAFAAKMERLLGAEYALFVQSLTEERVHGLRVNTLKITPEDLISRLSIPTARVPWCPDGFYYPDTDADKPSKHPYYHAGLYYIQEPSAMSTAAVLPIAENDSVLDLCAAPGGKSTQIAARLNGTGVLVSNDISASRCKALVKNIETAGVTNAIVLNESPERLVRRFAGFFDKVVVDAPCSGEGMFRKNRGMVKSWEPEKFRPLQKEIMSFAAQMLCGSGMMVYSTCTFSPEENEGIVDAFLKTHADFDIMAFDKSGGFTDGKPEWLAGVSPALGQAGRLMPYRVKGEGHFLCLLRKKDADGPNVPLPQAKPVPERDIELFRRFEEQTLTKRTDGIIARHGISLFRIPGGIDTKGLRVMRSGFYLGDIKIKRFEPSQALAMSLKMEEAKYAVNFTSKDMKLVRYLKGESFEVDAPDGWHLVCVDTFPLGFGKVLNGRMKNKRR